MLRSRVWVELTLTTSVVGPIIGALGVVVGLTNAPYAEPYWLDLSSKATGSLILLAPGMAAVSAWDGGRWRMLACVPARSWTQLLARHLAVVAGITAASFTATLVILAAQVTPITGLPRFDVLLTGVWMVVSYAAVGFVMGRFLPRLVAPTAAFATVWFWVAYTPSVEPFWLRNVNGNLAASCCSLNVELVDRALEAPALMGVALLVGAVVAMQRARAVAWLVAATALTVATVTASAWMSEVGADPVQARHGRQECIQRQETTVCAWPEHAGKLTRGAGSLVVAASRLRAVGLDVPSRLEENSHDGRGGWTFTLSASTTDVWVKTFATSPLKGLPPPCIDSNGGLWPAGDYQPLVTAWLETVAGVATPAEAADDSGADPVQLAHVLRRPEADQTAWYRAARQAMGGCEPLP